MNESSSERSASERLLAVQPEEAGLRLDRFLAARLSQFSRARLQKLVDEGRVRVDGLSCKPSHRLEGGESVVVEFPPEESLELLPEAIPIDVLYEDAEVAVVNKPAGMVVHPGAGAAGGTLAGALLHRFGSLSAAGGPLRPGIVHRLDKETSGVLIVARTDEAHHALVAEFRERHVEKTYVALLHGLLKEDSGRIELPVARDLRRRSRMTSRRREGRSALTDWRACLRFGAFTLVEARLHTGRTHQLRVHFSALGHTVVGDTLYGAPRHPRVGSVSLPPLGRNFLHAARVYFLHPRTDLPVDVRAPLPAELVAYLHDLARASGAAPAAVDAALRPYL